MSGIYSFVLLATRPKDIVLPDGLGLITMQLECPLYVWTELLTHRTLARNASSGRAMSVDRYAGMGFYVPDVFVQQGNGMQSSDTPIKYQALARLVYTAHWHLSVNAARILAKLGVAKEQANRIIPPTKIIRGIVTGNEWAWGNFLRLRYAPEADKAMRELAYSINYNIKHIRWNMDTVHMPMKQSNEALLAMGLDLSFANHVAVAAARIARVSYARQTGKDDKALSRSLRASGHLSPFEHIAVWTENPKPSVFTHNGTYKQKPTEGWESYRCFLE